MPDMHDPETFCAVVSIVLVFGYLLFLLAGDVLRGAWALVRYLPELIRHWRRD